MQPQHACRTSSVQKAKRTLSVLSQLTSAYVRGSSSTSSCWSRQHAWLNELDICETEQVSILGKQKKTTHDRGYDWKIWKQAIDDHDDDDGKENVYVCLTSHQQHIPASICSDWRASRHFYISSLLTFLAIVGCMIGERSNFFRYLFQFHFFCFYSPDWVALEGRWWERSMRAEAR